jgi:hypothetical protein
LKNTLLRAGLSAGASYLGKQLPIGSGASRVATQKATQGVTQGTSQGVTQGVAQGVTPGLAQAVGNQVANQVVEAAIPEIIVPASGKAAAFGVGTMLGAGIGSLASGALSRVHSLSNASNTTQQLQPAQQKPGEIVVTGKLPPASPLNVGATLGAAPGVIYSPDGQVDEIVVSGWTPEKEPTISPAEAALILGTGAAGVGAATTGGSSPSNPRNRLDDLGRYLRYGSLGIGLLGSLFEGGGRKGGNIIPLGFGNQQLNPVFGGQLPAPNIPGASDSFAPRSTDFDWYRYGYGPGQSFFSYVPQGLPNTSAAYTGYAQGGLAAGSMTRMSGRSDDIPALLSDGEYVIDAETVALLGDGSTKAGAARLDKFRVNVRKHKGKKLAKGQFSPAAKPVERYMQGDVS